MKMKDEGICLFVRDETTRRIMFNATALRELGINPIDARDRGYPLLEQPTVAEVAEAITAA
jgi:hypothetical protein